MGGAAFDGATKIEDVQLYLVAPDMTTTFPIETQITSCRLLRGPLCQDVLTIQAPLESVVCSASNGSSAALRDDWVNWALVLYVHGIQVFDGPVVGTEVNWNGITREGEAVEHPGSSVTLIAECWFTYEARRRYVATAYCIQYSKTDSPNRIFCDLIRTSMVTGEVVLPDGWQQGSETRDDQGVTSVACALPTAAGSSIAYKQDFGMNLLDALLDLCNYMPDDADKLWPAYSRTGSTVTLSVKRGRSGVGRGIGVDRTRTGTTPIEVSASRGNLVGYKRSTDRTKKENHIVMNGAGSGLGQYRVYVTDAGDTAANGVFEGWEIIEHARTTAELEQEGARLLFERKGGLRKDDYVLAEKPGFQVFKDFDIADSLAIEVPIGQKNPAGSASPQMDETNIIGLEWSIEGKGPAKCKMSLGQWPRTPERDLGRAGGGLTCGRGGGGRPRKKTGEYKVNPEDIKAFLTIKGDDGNSAVADVYNDEISLLRYDANTYVRTYSRAGDDPEVITHMIEGDYVATPVDTTGYVKLRQAGGGVIYLAATTTDPGGG